MKYMIKELREITGLTQKAFAAMYEIPISTLRKWEQGEASPAPYVLNLIARTLPGTDAALKRFRADNGCIYYYNIQKKTISDARGNTINVQEELIGVNEQNLAIYLQELFESFYEIQEKFNRDCRYDKEEDIVWTR